MMTITDATAPYIFKTGNIPTDLEAAIGRYMVKKHTIKKKQNSMATPKTGNRLRIWEVITENGPISAREAGEKVGLETSGSGQHIISLELQGMIEFVGMGKYKAPQKVKLWKATGKPYGNRSATIDKRSKQSRVVASLVEHGPMMRDQITKHTSLPKSTLQGYMPALIRDGRVFRTMVKTAGYKRKQVHYFVEKKND